MVLSGESDHQEKTLKDTDSGCLLMKCSHLQWSQEPSYALCSQTFQSALQCPTLKSKAKLSQPTRLSRKAPSIKCRSQNKQKEPVWCHLESSSVSSTRRWRRKQKKEAGAGAGAGGWGDVTRKRGRAGINTNLQQNIAFMNKCYKKAYWGHKKNLWN